MGSYLLVEDLSRSLGPGSVPEQAIRHRVRIDMTKLDHFVNFINRPYFYQNVSLGAKLSLGCAYSDKVHHDQPGYSILSGGKV